MNLPRSLPWYIHGNVARKADETKSHSFSILCGRCMVVNCFCIFNPSQPTANSRNSKPHRWRTGGGIEQEWCVYCLLWIPSLWQTDEWVGYNTGRLWGKYIDMARHLGGRFLIWLKKMTTKSNSGPWIALFEIIPVWNQSFSKSKKCYW